MNEEKTEKFAERVADCLSEITAELRKSVLKNLSETKLTFNANKTNNTNMVHISEIEAEVRKIVLDTAPHGKKTETDTTDKPLEGDVSKERKIDVETRFNEVIKKKGAI